MRQSKQPGMKAGARTAGSVMRVVLPLSLLVPVAPAWWPPLARPAVAQEAPAKISKDQAGQNALQAVPGKVSDVSIERKGGKNVYVVEIIADKDGEEVDVLVDMDSGKVLGADR